MRNLIDIVSNEQNEILAEAKQDYIAMFNGVLAAVSDESWRKTDRQDDPAVNIAEKYREKLSMLWEKEVKWARENLKRQDRIVWYLRYSRRNLLTSHQSAMDAAKMNRLIADYDKTNEEILYDSGIKTMKETLVHFLSLPIPAVQDYQFRLQSFRQVNEDMMVLEGQWKEKLDGTLADDDSKIIIDFKNGWCWVNTEKAYCSKEAKAMGHCGNEPRSGSGDHLLSLRKKIEMGRDDKGKVIVRWEPHLTFIVTQSGMLTEMKGKGNDKPVARYHSMIVALLESDIIEGIVGGGYMPENNFSINDLPADVRDSLLEKKPELGTLYDMYEKRGFDSVVKARLESMLSDVPSEYGRTNNLEIHDYDGENVILQQWNDIQTFIRDEFSDDRAGLEQIANLADMDYNEIEWLDVGAGGNFNDEVSALREMIDVSEGGDDAEFTRVKKFERQLALKIGVSPEEAVDALDHIFPKSVPEVFKHVKSFATNWAIAETKRFLRNVRLDFWVASLDVDDEGKVNLTCSVYEIITALTDHSTEYENGDDTGFSRAASNGQWVTYYDVGVDDDEDEDSVSFANVYTKVQQELIDQILSLFETNDQLSFDFNQ